MSYNFFSNAIENGATKQPNCSYRELQQAFINDQWDNTVAIRHIKEQDIVNQNFDNFTFHDIEVWIDYVVGETSSGRKTSEDFASLIFRDINYQTYKGRYYQFDNNYWLSYFQNTFNGVTPTLAVRRCNNFLRIVDPENGGLYTIPCVVDYDMAAPARQIGQDIITPNNHATIMVQGNKDTYRLFKTNSRFILSGRPFKLTGYQNALNNDYFENRDTLWYLDLFLDELWANDDLENAVADNGEYNYTVTIENDNNINNEFKPLSTGTFYASVMLNGEKVNRDIIWESSDNLIIQVGKNGNFIVKGQVGEKVNIMASLKDNPTINDVMTIEIVNETEPSVFVALSPSFDKIREREMITFKIQSIYNDVEYNELTETQVSLNETKEVLANENLVIQKNGNEYTLNCLKRSKVPQTLYVSVSNAEPLFTGSEKFNINLVSLMG